jgi:hypothetical protein
MELANRAQAQKFGGLGPTSSLSRLLSPIDWTEHFGQFPSLRRVLAFQFASWQEPSRPEPALRPSAPPSVSSEPNLNVLASS